MDSYSKAAMERAMKVQEVILRAMAKKITWWPGSIKGAVKRKHFSLGCRRDISLASSPLASSLVAETSIALIVFTPALRRSSGA